MFKPKKSIKDKAKGFKNIVFGFLKRIREGIFISGTYIAISYLIVFVFLEIRNLFTYFIDFIDRNIGNPIYTILIFFILIGILVLYISIKNRKNKTKYFSESEYEEVYDERSKYPQLRPRYRYRNSDKGYANKFPEKTESNGCSIIIFILGLLCTFFALPVLIIYWYLHPDLPKRAIKISVFFLSFGVSLIYYFFNSDEFPKLTDKIGFFSGSLIPPTAVDIIM